MKFVILGAGGHGTVVASALLGAGVDVLGFLDNRPDRDSFAFGPLRIVGTDDAMPTLARDDAVRFICGVGGVGDNGARREVFRRAIEVGLKPMSFIHPSALIERDCRIGDGSFVGAGAIINVGTQIGLNAIVNSGAIIEHHCRIGDHVHVSSGAILCGGVVVEDETHVGAGAVVRQGLHIGRAAIVGIGGVVVTDIGDGIMAVGNPARQRARGQ